MTLTPHSYILAAACLLLCFKPNGADAAAQQELHSGL